TTYRWERCIRHRGSASLEFMADHFGEPHRRGLLICAAGFDPRSPQVCTVLAGIMGPRLRGILIREERPVPHHRLVRAAESNLAMMTRWMPAHEVVPINVFSADGAAVGGREAVRGVQRLRFDEVTDVIVDCSALSIGLAFPLVRHLLTRATTHTHTFNLHLMV